MQTTNSYGVARLQFPSAGIQDPTIAQAILKNFEKGVGSLADLKDFKVLKSTYDKDNGRYYIDIATPAERDRVINLANVLTTSYRNSMPQTDFTFDYTNNGVMSYDENGFTRKSPISEATFFKRKYVTALNPTAKKYARDVIKRNGWVVEPTTSKDKIYYSGFSYEDENGVSNTGLFNTATLFSPVYKENARERARIAQKEEEQKKKEAEIEAKKAEREEQKWQKERQRIWAKDEKDKKRAKEQAERKQKQEEKEELRKKEEQEKEKEKEEQQRKAKTHSILHNILKAIATITALLLGIGKAVVDVMQTAVSSRLGSIGLGISARDFNKYQIMSQTVGLGKDTLTNGMLDVQSKFGNIDHLDDNAIKTLAPAIQADLEPLIKSGMYKDRIDDLTAIILDKYLELYRQGKNHLGEYVGKEKAGSELMTNLSMVSGDLGQVFGGMIAYGYDNFDSFKKGTLSPQNSALVTEYLAEIGKYINETKIALDNLKTSILTPLHGLVRTIADNVVRIAEKNNPDEISKAERVVSQRKVNAETIQSLEELLSTESTFAEYINDKKLVMTYGGGKLDYENIPRLYETYGAGFLYKVFGATDTARIIQYIEARKMLKKAQKNEAEHYSKGEEANPYTMAEFGASVELASSYKTDTYPVDFSHELGFDVDAYGNFTFVGRDGEDYSYRKNQWNLWKRGGEQRRRLEKSLTPIDLAILRGMEEIANTKGTNERNNKRRALVSQIALLTQGKDYENVEAFSSQKTFELLYNFYNGTGNLNGGKALNLDNDWAGRVVANSNSIIQGAKQMKVTGVSDEAVVNAVLDTILRKDYNKNSNGDKYILNLRINDKEYHEEFPVTGVLDVLQQM